MHKFKNILKVFLISSLTSGCAGSNGINWVHPICVSKNDVLTDGTKQQIVTLDETLGKKCVKDK